MAAQVRLRDSGGTLRTIARIRARDEGGVLRTIQRIRIRDASNVLRTVWQAFAAAVDTAITFGYYRGSSSAAQNITVSSVVASPNAGTAPYTYAWAQVGTSAYTWTILNATSASTSFTAQSVGPGAQASATFRVTITDSGGATAMADVTARAINESTA